MNQLIRILYIDDYPLDRELVRDALEKEHGGFEVVEAASRVEFETMLAQGGFDLILSDFNILGFEGLQVLDAVHAIDAPPPVIIVTGTGSEEVAAEAMKRGAADYVIKTPQHIQRLPHIIHFVLEKKQLEDERRQAEEALRESETRFSTIFHASPAAIAMTRLGDNQFVDVNAAWQAMTGYTRAEVMGHTSYELNLWTNPEQRQQLIETLRAQGAARDEIQIRRKSGETGDILISAELIELAGEQHLLTLAQDITERKQAEEALRKSETKYRQIYSSMMDAYVKVDMTGRIVEFNHAYQAMLGYSAEELQQLTYVDLTPAKWHTFEAGLVAEQIIPHGYSDVYEKEYIRKDGTVFPVELRTFLLTDESQHPVAMWAIVRDITERKRAAEEAVRVAREWQTTFDAANDAFWILDREQRVLRSNHAAERFFQRPCQDLIGKHCWEIVHGTAQPIPGCPILRVKNSLRRETLELQMGEGWFQITVDPILDAAGRYDGAVHIVSDITARKRTEAQLTEQLDELRRWHTVTLGRETRILELKREVNELLRRLNEPARYPSAEEPA